MGGVICYQKKYYSFATMEAFNNFIENPSHYLKNLHDLIIEYPFLVRMFSLTGKLRSLSLPLRRFDKPSPILEEFTTREKQRLKKVSVAINTPTHFQESNIDHSYRWNEWDMRRDCLKWTNLQNKKTSS